MYIPSFNITFAAKLNKIATDTIDENYLEEIFKANYAGYGFNELLKIPDNSVSYDIKCLAMSPYGNECFHLIDAAICLAVIRRGAYFLPNLGFNGEALTEAAQKRFYKAYANSVKDLSGFRVLHGRLTGSYSIAQFRDECISKVDIEALVNGRFSSGIYMADCLTYYKRYCTSTQARLYPYIASYKGYTMDGVIYFVRNALLREKDSATVEELMELEHDLTKHRGILTSSTLLTCKDLNELQKTVEKLRGMLNDKIYFNAANNSIIYGENGQYSEYLDIRRIDKQYYNFESGDEHGVKQSLSFFDDIQRVSKSTKDEMLRKIDLAIGLVSRYIEQENNKRKK